MFISYVVIFRSVMATGSDDGKARIWSTTTDRCVCAGVFTGHEEYINAIAFQGGFLITGSSDSTIRKWDMFTCECVHVFRGHGALVNELICTKKFIFSSSADHTARCWGFDNGESLRVFKGHTMSVASLIFLPGEDVQPTDNDDQDGNKELLITGAFDNTARSWSFETGKTLHIFKAHSSAITCMTTDPSRRTLFTGSTDCTIRSWNILTGHALKVLVLGGHSKAVTCLTVS